jgi:heme exporter protein D
MVDLAQRMALLFIAVGHHFRYAWTPLHVLIVPVVTHFLLIYSVMSKRWLSKDVHDLTATVRYILHYIGIEPDLQPLGGEVMFDGSANVQEGVCLAITANELWGGLFQKIFFDV